MGDFPGVYRAKFLGADLLGNVQCTIPAVTGDTPRIAFSADFEGQSQPSPGDVGWIVFEGADPSNPVWIGALKPNDDWSRPWGIVAPPVQVTPGMTGVTTTVDVTNLVLNWAPSLNRYYVLRARVRVVQASGGTAQAFIANSANTALSATDGSTPGTGETDTLYPQTIPTTFTPAARSDKVRFGSTASMSTNGPAWMWAEDVGPSGARPATFINSPINTIYYITTGLVTAVTSASVFTITVNGGSVVNPVKVAGYYPAVGDIVRVEFNGPYVTVLGTTTEDPWHLVGGGGEPAFANSWTNFSSGWQVARSRRSTDGRIHVEGLVKSGNMSTAVFQLPAGYRPSGNVRLSDYIVDSAGHEQTYRVDVDTSGNVSVGIGSTAAGAFTNPAGNASIAGSFGLG